MRRLFDIAIRLGCQKTPAKSLVIRANGHRLTTKLAPAFRTHAPHPETRPPSLREHSAPPHLRLKPHPACNSLRSAPSCPDKYPACRAALASGRNTRRLRRCRWWVCLQPQLIPHLIYLCFNSRVHHDGRTPYTSRLARPFIGRIQPHLAA